MGFQSQLLPATIRYIFWQGEARIVHQLAIVGHCMAQIAIQHASTVSRRHRVRDASQRWIDLPQSSSFISECHVLRLNRAFK